MLHGAFEHAVGSDHPSAGLLGTNCSDPNCSTKVPGNSSEETFRRLEVFEVLDCMEVLDVDGMSMKRVSVPHISVGYRLAWSTYKVLRTASYLYS